MGKTIRDQLAAAGLVSDLAARREEEKLRRRVRRECFENALTAARKIEMNHREVVVEQRLHRTLAGVK